MFHFAKLSAAFAAATLIAGVASAQTVLRSSDTHPDGYPTVEAVKYFGDLIKERTDGRYEVEVYFGAQLGQEADTIEQVRSGVIDLNRVSMAPWNSLVPLTMIPSLPYLFRSAEHARNVMSGPIGDEIAAGFEEHGVVVLAYYDGGSRSFYNSKKPINAIGDLAGQKYRVIQSDVFVDMVAALGASATPMPYGEVYSGIETGVIDGAENNFPSYESAKHYEVAKNYSLDEHTIVPEVFVMSKVAWDKLTPEDQAIFKQAARESMEKQWELWDARVQESRKIVEEAGAQITTPEKQPFIDAMKPVYDKYVNTPELQDLVARIQATEG
jgi:tripartite ATP-independent transporter DctP family solute receptor